MNTFHDYKQPNSFEELKKAIAFNIKDARMSKGLSQKQLADSITGCGQSVIGRIESEGSNITLSTLFKISKALDVDIERLVTFDHTGYPLDLTPENWDQKDENGMPRWCNALLKEGGNPSFILGVGNLLTFIKNKK